MIDKVVIAPSLLSCNFAFIAEEVAKVTEAGADMLHLDVMDGHFVENITFGPCVVKAIKQVSTIPLDVHLMIANPEKYVDAFLDAGSDIITFHIEATDNSSAIIEKIKNNNCKAAISVKPNTPIEEIEHLLPILDMVLIMSVEPGFGGQAFIPEVLNKARWLRNRSDCPADIEIDGGINDQTAVEARKAGVNVLVAGSYIFKGDYRERILRLR